MKYILMWPGVIIYGTNIIFYGVFAIVFIIGLCKLVQKKLPIAIIYLTVGVSPVPAYFAVKTSVDREAVMRQNEIAAWPRQPISGDHSVASMDFSETYSLLGTDNLLMSGVLQSISNKEKTLHAEWGIDCVVKSASYDTRVNLGNSARARNAYMFCIRETKRQSSSRPPIQLFIDGRAPNKNLKCGTNVSGGAMELRWSEQLGGQMIDYQELPYERKIVSAFINVPGSWANRGFYRTRCIQRRTGSRIHPYKRLNRFKFVASHLGFRSLDDFPRKVSADEALQALRMVYAASQGSVGTKRPNINAVVLLLGQWPSTPEMSAFIRTSIRDGRLIYNVFAKAGNKETKDLLPHLTSHIPDFLAVCAKGGTYQEYCDGWTIRYNRKAK